MKNNRDKSHDEDKFSDYFGCGCVILLLIAAIFILRLLECA